LRDTRQFTVRSTDAADNTGEDQFTWTANNPSAAAAPGRQEQESSLGFKGCLSLQKVSTTWDEDAAASATSIIMSRKVRGI
jgi:hypothetical protein